MRKCFYLMLSSLFLPACFPAPPGSGPSPDAGGGGDPCTRTSAVAGESEGYPFDPSTFDSQILPELQTGCANGLGCHGPGNGNNLTVFLDTDSSCANVETFNEVARLTDLENGPAASPIITAIDGTLAAHPFKPPVTDTLVGLLEGYITTAKDAYDQGGGGGGGGGDPAAAFDLDTFTNQIQPILDNSNCINSGCHDINGGNLGGGFGMYPGARPSADQIQANLEAVVGQIDTSLSPAQAQQAAFYQRAAVDRHAGLVVGNPQALEDWIAAGLTALSQ